MNIHGDLYRDVTGVILAGGKSRRMGNNKAFLKVGGIPLIERVSGVLSRIFENVFLVTNDPATYASIGFPVYTDIYPDRASLVGIYTGLLKAKTPYIFCASCDMPFLSQSLIRLLVEKRENADLVLPFSNNGREPLHAVYGKNCLSFMGQMILENRMAIKEIFDQVRTEKVKSEEVATLDPKFLSFLNCNTPEDYEMASEIFKKMEDI